MAASPSTIQVPLGETSLSLYRSLSLSPSLSHTHTHTQFSGDDGGYPEAVDGPGVPAGVQRGAESRTGSPQEHSGQSGTEEVDALYHVTAATGR